MFRIQSFPIICHKYNICVINIFLPVWSLPLYFVCSVFDTDIYDFYGVKLLKVPPLGFCFH